jgi:hypothetical protein
VRRRGFNRRGLAALLPVHEGRRDELADAIQALPSGPDSPFARIGSTHFARLVVLDGFPGRDGGTLPGMPACLFFGAEFDIPEAGYLEALCTLMPDEADALFGRCLEYPGADVPPLFKSWMLRHRVPAGFSLHANPGASVAEVVDCLRLRESIIAFAVDTRAMAPAALKRRWDQQDWESRT